jgi:hypothetical protein
MGALAMTSPKEYRQFALDCGKQAAETNDERLREILNETARMWMRVALNVERSWALKSDEAPSTQKQSISR